jgi:hypothetical protein
MHLLGENIFLMVVTRWDAVNLLNTLQTEENDIRSHIGTLQSEIAKPLTQGGSLSVFSLL